MEVYYGKGFLSVNEVSQYLGIKPSTIYQWLNEMPHYRIGRLIRFKKDEIDNWMKGHRRNGANPEIKVRSILKDISRPINSIDKIVKKSIAEVKGLNYTPNHGRPDQIRGLRKEGNYGALS